MPNAPPSLGTYCVFANAIGRDHDTVKVGALVLYCVGALVFWWFGGLVFCWFGCLVVLVVWSFGGFGVLVVWWFGG